jgi:2-polyprenyl-3-methyl-5-hydroxy-6-metoxy-1,4-benzoquinol methylase
MKKQKKIFKVKDHFLSNEFFSLTYDQNTTMFVTNPKPDEDKMESYYESSRYLSHQKTGNDFFSKAYFLSRQFTTSLKTRMISSLFSKPGKVLDVGSGTGELLTALKNEGWNVKGIEPNKAAKQTALDKGISHEHSLGEVEKNSLDLVVFWHSLEHLYDLNNTLNEVKKILKPTGILMVACPNHESWDAKYYGSFWAAWDVPRHLSHFSSKSLNIILKPQGFKQIRKSPLFLDAIYVSILSEKIKKNKAVFLKGLIIGLISNFAGFFTKNYSSHVYFFKNN